jgi:PAS domain S-box-containing protein
MKPTANTDKPLPKQPNLFEGGGEMGALMEAYHWTSHPLREPEGWPHSLQTGIRMMLRSGFPMFIWWSNAFYMFHNDPYLPALGKKHPAALGASAREMWSEIWSELGVIAESILTEASNFYAEDLLILLDRKGFLEETYWTFSYSPMPQDDGSVGGVFCACTEVSNKVLGQRRLNTINEIAGATTQAMSVEQASQQACCIIANNRQDVPFSLIYLLKENGTHATLAGSSGNFPAAAVPQVVDLASPEKMGWPLRYVLHHKQQLSLNKLKDLFGELYAASIHEGVEQAVVLPVLQPGKSQLYGFLVLGVSPRLEYDADYQGFHSLLARQIASTISSVQARFEVEASELRLRQMANSIPHLALTTSANGSVEYGNQQWYDYTGFTEEETLGRAWAKAIHPDDAAHARESWKHSMETGESIEVEYRLRRADGLYRWHLVHAVAGHDEDGNRNRWYGTLTDIHDHKLAEDALRQSKVQVQAAHAEAELQRARLERLFMEAPAAITIVDGPDMVFELVNPGYQQLFPNRLLRGLPVLEALPEIANQPIYAILRNVYQTGETYEGREERLRLARTENGPLEDIYFNFIYQARYNRQGQVDGIVVFAYEVTDLVEARQGVERSEENLRMALEAGNMATFNLDFLTNQTTRSSRHDELFGYESQLLEWNKEALLRHILPEDRDLVLVQYERAMQTGELFFDVRILHADGQLRWIEVHGKVFYDPQGQPVRLAGVVADVTERKVAEQKLQALTQELEAANKDIQASNKELAFTNEQLKRINSDLDNFVYTASHDLRSPINSMEGLLLVLQEQLDGKLEEEDHILISHLTTSMAKLNQTIEDLSEIVKAQKETELPVEAVPVQDILDDVLADINTLSTNVDAVIVCDLGVESVDFPRKHLRSILYNLLSNALKYHHPDRPPKVVVRTSQYDDRVLLSVADNGLGLTPRQVKKLFGLFQRMHTHAEGNGIGLYTIKRVIENYGGEITVESKEGTGTTFYVYFPGAR